ncbi:nucleoporin NUP42 [Fukomys damarensis]|uniref:Nucleoporin NUP42 n=1 Tax=Fukomys damarensis TaxID=885580 RepID=A0A091D6F4_FUKDA|nr:nucleoporin NUP42 [Fukomys damarensis]KFO26073.1 Nucleoporin-like protein 2 [Fukomys damarensis]
MAICQFFLQGRCRFGDRCWNEHPGARGAGRGRQQQPSGSNRNEGNATSQRYSSIIQPSSFSKSTPWGGSRDQEKSSFSSFDSKTSTSRNTGFGLSQNPFASPSSEEQKDEKKLLEGIIKDMEIWESSGQWMFSVYSPVKKKPSISGFTDISPEELRLEYHNLLTSNNLQSYLNSVQQLVNQWRNRINELKKLNTSTKVALLAELKDEANHTARTFGFGSGQAGTFGSPGFPVNNNSSASTQNFSFKTNGRIFTAPAGSPSVFGAPPAFGAVPSTNSASSTSTPNFGFGKPEITSAASFSFKSTSASTLGSPGLSGFPTSVSAGPFGSPAAPAFGSGSSVAGFGSSGSHSLTAISKPSNDVFGGGSTSTSLPVSSVLITTDNVLFTPKDQLTAEELEQFQSKKFTLGKIPLKPPPMELLNI